MSFLLDIKHPVTMSSREIAELVEVGHDRVLKTIRLLIDRGIVKSHETPYIHPQNGQSYPAFALDFRDAMMVVSGYSADVRGRVIDRWLDLEQQQKLAIPQTMPEALRLAADLAERAAHAECALAIATPKASALDRIATETEGAVCLRVAAKLLQMPEKRFLRFAYEKGFIFRSHHSRTWQGYSEKAKAGLLQLKLTTVQCTDGSEKRVEQVLITRAGLAKLAELIERERAA